MNALILAFVLPIPEPVIIETKELEDSLPLPTVPGATHTRLPYGLVTHEFAECDLCGESLGVAGHDDVDCPDCSHAACSSFGCGRCALLQDVDR